jgi:hypothetical protein
MGMRTYVQNNTNFWLKRIIWGLRLCGFHQILAMSVNFLYYNNLLPLDPGQHENLFSPEWIIYIVKFNSHSSFYETPFDILICCWCLVSTALKAKYFWIKFIASTFESVDSSSGTTF